MVKRSYLVGVCVLIVAAFSVILSYEAIRTDAACEPWIAYITNVSSYETDFLFGLGPSEPEVVETANLKDRYRLAISHLAGSSHILSSPDNILGFSWSLDGRSIIFQALKGFHKVAVSSRGFGAPRKIASLREEATWVTDHQSWFLDGQRVLCLQGGGLSNSLLTLNIRTRQWEKLYETEYGKIIESPVVSPLTDTVAFLETSTSEQLTKVTLLGPDGKNSFPLDGAAGRLSWSPDAQSLLFEGLYPQRKITALCRLDVRTGEMTQLTKDPAEGLLPAWAPDGKQIAYVSYAPGHSEKWQIWIMDADGSNPHRLTSGDAPESYPTWSPDGKHIAYIKRQSGRCHIWLTDLATGEAHQVTSGTQFNSISPQWQPRTNAEQTR